jgi:hypothetical protein
MVIPDTSLDWIYPLDGTPEESLFCAVIKTFVQDIDHIQSISKKYAGKPLPNSVKYSELHPYIELHSLVSEINHEWTEHLCDFAGVNYKVVRLMLLKRIHKKLGRKFY